MENRLFTSESVTEGHPDKVCDQVSDAVLDAILAIEPEAHVACEVSATTGMIVLMGEISANALNHVDVEQVVRDTVRDIGYSGNDFGFNADGIAVISALHAQSPDIAQGVNNALETRYGKMRILAQAIRVWSSVMRRMKQKHSCQPLFIWRIGLHENWQKFAKVAQSLIWGRMERPKFPSNMQDVKL